MNYQLNTTEREARVDVVSNNGERVGYVVADVYTPNQIWGRGHCASDVLTLLDRYPSAPRVLIVRASYLDYGIRSAGVGTRMYDTLIRGAGDHFRGPTIVIPDGCWDGSTSEAAQRVWSKLRQTWDSAGNVVAAVPVVPAKAEPSYSYKGNPEAIAFLLDARSEGLPNPREVHERAALKPGRTVGLLLGGTDTYRRVLLFDASALKRGEDPEEAILGEITMKSLKRGACRSPNDVPAFTIATSVAKQGWGPALYDTAISVAAHEGFAGVIPDRDAVSNEARRLWAFYANRRPDVGRTAATGCALWGDEELDSIYMPRRQKGLVNISGLLERGRDGIRASARARRCSQLEIEVELFDAGGHWFGREYSNAMVSMNRRRKGRERRAALPLAAEVEGVGLVLEGVPE
jgi:hypothetical protein